MDRKLETRIVKEALRKAGYTAKVGHGKGTAWGWLHINDVIITRADGCYCTLNQWDQVETCHKCSEKWRENYNNVERIAQATTGRRGEYGGNINVEINFDNYNLPKAA
jgi:hypothetical protein